MSIIIADYTRHDSSIVLSGTFFYFKAAHKIDFSVHIYESNKFQCFDNINLCCLCQFFFYKFSVMELQRPFSFVVMILYNWMGYFFRPPRAPS